ncbi:thiamine diphosphokinase [Anaeromicropila herbilytica]|uniref:Thiamine diphosphokinase n=1 Tax=Anaeromicropila herbilytica TaxID=2785025 RepID=A0A7R7IDY7_9FIRM|nr:thiamine diphosphokinase [Anaeromicropila herbilytica]BCN31564.1 thiamine pyrophosphokinase [Anaeromicropila herbilytica]
MQNVVLIITGGEVTEQLLENVRKKNQFNITIAVDRGLEIATQCKLKIDYLVGDFDSVDATVLEHYRQSISDGKIDTTLKVYNPIKDSTDTQIAIELALSLQCTKIILVGATGSRFDHVLANVNLLMLPLLQGIEATIIDHHNKIYLMDGLHRNSIKIEKLKQYGKYISLLPLTEKVEGVSLEGFKYPLQDRTLIIGDSLGVSNELEDEYGDILIKSGILIVVESKD